MEKVWLWRIERECGAFGFMCLVELSIVRPGEISGCTKVNANN